MSAVETLLAEVMAAHAGVRTYLMVGQFAYRCTCGLVHDKGADDITPIQDIQRAHVAAELAQRLRSAGYFREETQ